MHVFLFRKPVYRCLSIEASYYASTTARLGYKRSGQEWSKKEWDRWAAWYAREFMATDRTFVAGRFLDRGGVPCTPGGGPGAASSCGGVSNTGAASSGDAAPSQLAAARSSSVAVRGDGLVGAERKRWAVRVWSNELSAEPTGAGLASIPGTTSPPATEEGAAPVQDLHPPPSVRVPDPVEPVGEPAAIVLVEDNEVEAPAPSVESAVRELTSQQVIHMVDRCVTCSHGSSSTVAVFTSPEQEMNTAAVFHFS